MAVYNKGLICLSISSISAVEFRRFVVDYEKLQLLFEEVFTESIRKFGFSNFKQTSLFGSNEKLQPDMISEAA